MKRTFLVVIALGFLAVRAYAAKPEPIISVSVNDRRAVELFPEMPMLVSVSLLHPSSLDSNANPILIAAAQGPWTNAVHLEVSDDAGNLQSWPFHTSIAPS